jgi:hypothetical protein
VAIKRQPSGSPRLLSGHCQITGKRFPPKHLAKTSASSGIAKQNATKSMSSRRREYVSVVADSTPAAQNITSPLLRPRTFSPRERHVMRPSALEIVAGDCTFVVGHHRIDIGLVLVIFLT